MSEAWAYFNDHPEIERAKKRMIWRLSLLFAVVFFGLSLAFWNSDFNAWLSYFIAFLVACLAIAFLLIFKKHKPLYFFYAFFGSILSQVACNISMTTTHYVDFLWMMMCTLIAFIGLGRKVGLIFMIGNAIGVYIFFQFSLNHHIEVLKPLTQTEIYGAIAELFLALTIILTVFYEFLRYQDFAMRITSQLNYALSIKNKEIEKKNNENIVLLKEVHHRVKNNLQIIISLLRLQLSENVKNSDSNIFNEAINRILSMALIHEKLYGQRDLSILNIEKYISDLFNELKKSYNLPIKVELEVNSDIKGFDLKTAVPIGLILNELITNSFKHGFQLKSNNACIRISIYNDNLGKFRLEYSDNGVGMDSKINVGFGSEMVNLLVEQLNGKILTKDLSHGANYKFLFS